MLHIYFVESGLSLTIWELYRDCEISHSVVPHSRRPSNVLIEPTMQFSAIISALDTYHRVFRFRHPDLCWCTWNYAFVIITTALTLFANLSLWIWGLCLRCDVLRDRILYVLFKTKLCTHEMCLCMSLSWMLCVSIQPHKSGDCTIYLFFHWLIKDTSSLIQIIIILGTY